jgi:hypothetical protein
MKPQPEPLCHRIAIVVEADDLKIDKYQLWAWAHDRVGELASDLRRRGPRAPW